MAAERLVLDHLLGMDIANLEAVLGLPWAQDDITEPESGVIGTLASLDDEKAAAIIALSWTQDDITGPESGVIETLASLDNERVAAIIALPWAQDDITELERKTIDLLGSVANPETFLSLAWLQDGITETDQMAISLIVGAANPDAVLSLAWVQDGVSNAELRTMGLVESLTNPEAIWTSAWMRDGISELESEAVGMLVDINAYTPTTAGIVLDSVWLVDDITEMERDALQLLYWMSVENEEAATAVVALPWMQDDITGTERDALEWIRWLAKNSEQAAASINTLPWVQDDITDTERDALKWLSWLAHDSEQASVTVNALPWVQDDITGTERDALEWIRWLAKNSEQAAASINTLPWVQDDITDTERDALEWLSWLAHDSEQAAAAVIALPWAQDGVTVSEVEAVRQLTWLNDDDDEDGIAVIEAIVALSWVQDDITETEAEFLDFLERLDDDNEKAAVTIIALPWVQDGVTGTEVEAIRQVAWLNDDDDEDGIAVIEAIVALSWVQDDITETEAEFLDFLERLDDDNEKAAVAIIAMPFLKSLEPEDVLAVRGIRRLASDDDNSLLPALMDHPSLLNGITDDQTTLVTAAGTMWDADEIRRLLDPGYADIETLSSGTMLTPDLKVSIIRTGTQSQPGTAEGARNAVEFAEKIMQLPLPVSHVIVVLNEKAVPPQYAGANHGIAFSYNPEREHGQTPYDRHTFLSGIVHETAHYYWRGHADWLDEGVANIFEYIYGVENGVSPGLVEITQREDCEIHNLETLTELSPDGEEAFDQFHCNYFLGQMLFLELLEHLGEEKFNERLRELYRLSLAAKEDGRTSGIAEVRRAFHDQTDIVEKHWSGKLNAPENRGFDEGMERTNHELIEWIQPPTYDGRSVSMEGVKLAGSVLVNNYPTTAGYPNYTLHPADSHDFLGSILPPLDGARWTLDDPGDVVATTYKSVTTAETRTFIVEFPFPQKLDGAPSDYVIIVWGFQDASHTPTIGKVSDVLGYARIRVAPE